MSRKIANIFVLLLFVVSTTGFTISRHYCDRNEDSSLLTTEHASCCDISSCECCHDENQFYYLDDDFTVSQNFTLKSQNPFTVVFSTIYNVEIKDQITISIQIFDEGPPFIDHQFLYYTHQHKLAPPVC